jgi:branched-chain amino acid transport system permease protein
MATAALALGLALFLAGLLPSSAAADIDPFQDARRICRTLLPGFVDRPVGLIAETVRWSDEGRTVVAYRWDADRNKEGASAGWLACIFLPLAETGGRWQVDRLESSKYGIMSRYDMQQLLKLLHMRVETSGAPAADAHYGAGYVLQQAINALALGCLYALVAVAFTLIYAAGRFVNFAFGPLVMIGAFTLLLSRGVVGLPGLGPMPSALLAVAAVALPAGAFGWAMSSAIFRRFDGRPLAAMIAAIGLAIALNESVRLLQGPQTQWLPFRPDAILQLGSVDGFSVVASLRHLAIGLATGLLATGLYIAGRRTGWGLSFRASVQDGRMAGLLGVDGARLIAGAFALGGMLAGLAGAFAAWHYGPVDFRMGMPLGFKALTAAVVGGLGSVPGAFLGGLVVASVEIAAAAAIGGAWRDVIVFGLLAAMLVLRPRGIAGTNV